VVLIGCPAVLLAQYDKTVATAQAMSSTFNLYGDKLTGTCFMVKSHGEQYFVTAAHLFQESHRTGDKVAIQMVVQNQLQGYEASKEMRMVGVISGYLPEPIDIKHKNETLSVMENSGIIVCYGTRYIGEIFKKNNLR